MGMFDEFHFHEPLRCAHGHEIRHAQTKCLANHLDHYHVVEGRVFIVLKGSDEPADITRRIEGDMLVETRVERLPPAKLRDGTIDVYITCQECDPVYTEGTSPYRELLSGHSPWCCWVLTVKDDRIVNIDAEKVESRDDVRRNLVKQGILPLPDDDRIVRRALERRRAERG